MSSFLQYFIRLLIGVLPLIILYTVKPSFLYLEDKKTKIKVFNMSFLVIISFTISYVLLGSLWIFYPKSGMKMIGPIPIDLWVVCFAFTILNLFAELHDGKSVFSAVSLFLLLFIPLLCVLYWSYGQKF
jgi:hypothetical protein